MLWHARSGPAGPKHACLRGVDAPLEIGRSCAGCAGLHSAALQGSAPAAALTAAPPLVKVADVQQLGNPPSRLPILAPVVCLCQHAPQHSGAIKQCYTCLQLGWDAKVFGKSRLESILEESARGLRERANMKGQGAWWRPEATDQRRLMIGSLLPAMLADCATSVSVVSIRGGCYRPRGQKHAV